MAIADGSLDEHRKLVGRILGSIPTHERPPQSVEEIASRVTEGLDGQPQEYIELLTATVIVFLNAFDVLTERGGCYQCRDEMPTYFVRSVAWYIDNGLAIVNNWERRGVGNDINISALLDAAPYLLRIMEDKRLRLATPGVKPAPARMRSVVSLLVKTVVDGQSLFLFQWDHKAAQYQLIGRNLAADEKESDAARGLLQQMVVEAGPPFAQGRDYDICSLDWDRPLPLKWTGASRTVGALTRYEVWTYGVQLMVNQLKLGERYEWLSIDEMLAGQTRSGRRTGDPDLYRRMDASLAGGLDGAPTSIKYEAIATFGGQHDAVVDNRSVFIGHGHSSVWRELADHLRDHHGYPIVTYESEPRAGQATIDVLKKLIAETSFAILVHTAEDEQAGGGLRARQNVIHETGLFQGRLGFTRAIIVRQRGCDAFSNLAGMHEVHYTTEIREAFGEVVAALRREFG